MNTLGQRITAQREAVGISPADLAKRSGISRSYLHEIEHSGKVRPSAELVYTIGEVLGVSFEYLIGKREIDGRRILQETPPAIEELAATDNLTESDVEMLTHISTDGKPRGVTEWRFIYQAIGYVCR